MCVASHIFSPATQSTNDARVLEIKFSKLQVEIVSGARSALRVLRTTNIWQFSMTTSTTTSSNDVAKNRVTREAEEKKRKRKQKNNILFIFLVWTCVRPMLVRFIWISLKKWKFSGEKWRVCASHTPWCGCASCFQIKRERMNAETETSVRLAATPVKRNRNAWLLRNTHPSISYRRRRRCIFFFNFSFCHLKCHTKPG